ncbi:hypothetical protein [Nocardia sp. NPDC051463]|uniref:hypothetical protein n=1 Tax=Nocardia sp. NPDC051463 TaxID=3154845 RepID=UPI00344E6EB4
MSARQSIAVDAEFEGIRAQLDADREFAEFADPSDSAFDATSGWCRPDSTDTPGNGSRTRH